MPTSNPSPRIHTWIRIKLSSTLKKSNIKKIMIEKRGRKGEQYDEYNYTLL